MVPLEPSTPDFLATLQTSLNSTFDAEYTQRASVLRGKPLHMAALANATALQAPQHFENVASYARFLGNEECAVIVEAHVAKTHVNGLLDKLGFNKPVAP